MTDQLSLPGIRRNRDPEVELERIKRDKDDLRHDIRVVLDRYAEAHEISPKAVNELMWGYVSDLISDFFFDRKEELRAEVEEDTEREGRLWEHSRTRSSSWR